MQIAECSTSIRYETFKRSNNKIVSLSDKVKDLSVAVRNIDGRLIRLETMVKLATKKQLHKKLA